MINLRSLNQLMAKAVSFSMNSLSTRLRFFIVFYLILCLPVFQQFVFGQEVENDPIKLFNLGQNAHEKGDLKNALKLYEESLKLAPEFPEAEFQRGNVLQSLGQNPEAEKAFRRALELREDWVLPMTSLGTLLGRHGKFAEADSLLNRAIEIDARNTAAYSALAELSLKAQVPPEKLKVLLQKLTDFANPDELIWAARGAIERRLGDSGSARKSLGRALTIAPKDFSAQSELIEILLTENEFAKALTNAEVLNRFYPDSQSARLLLARALVAHGDLDAALKILDSLEDQTEQVVNLRNEAISQSTADIGVLEKQLEKDSKNAIILGRLCSLTRTTPAKALDYCRRASEAEPGNVGHAIGFGAALVQAKQFESAVNLFRRLLLFAPDNFSIHANLATALFELKRYTEAKIEFNWLIEQKSDLAVAYYFLAIAHDNLAEYSDALTYYRQFLTKADAERNQLEIEKVKLRLPVLEKQIKSGKGKIKR